MRVPHHALARLHEKRGEAAEAARARGEFEKARALQAALVSAPDDFRPALAQSLRERGIDVPGEPCMKLVPTRERRRGALLLRLRA